MPDKDGSICLWMLGLCVAFLAIFFGYYMYMYAVGDKESCPDYLAGMATKIGKDLRHEFERRLHGQHLVTNPVIKAVAAHLENTHPQKALVLTFHGSTGIGKNFVSAIIADHLYPQGIKSAFVHTIIAPHHFPDASRVEIYKPLLQSWIRDNVTQCDQCLFIFDEVDKMPPGLLDSIWPYLEHYAHVDEVDYRKAIFIMISNIGGDAINRYTYEHWEKGGIREELTMREMEHLVHGAAYSEKGGLQKSPLLDKNLVSAFIPFLPLEEEHVKECIRDNMHDKGYDQYVSDYFINKVNKELSYWPEGIRRYSHTGCKRVSDKVDLIAFENKLKEENKEL